MKKQIWYQSVKHWILHFIQLQLFISLISLPILIAWGLPLSIVSPIANLIFSPILTAFLLVASLLFFTELLCIPNTWLAWCLNQITNFWYTILAWNQETWLYGFVKPSPWFLCLIPAVAFIIIYNRETKKPIRAIAALTLLFFGVALASHISSKTKAIHYIPFGNKEVTFIHNDNNTMLIDTGTIATRASAPSWINYTLMPYIVQTTGNLKIDHVIITKPSARVFEALGVLCTKMQVNNIYLPYWQGPLPKNAWRNYFTMQRALQEKNGKMIRIGKQEINVLLNQYSHITIKALAEQCKYHEATFSVLHIHGNIEDKKIDINNNNHKGCL